MRLPRWSTACPDWAERIVAGQSLVPFAPLFPDKAADALAVFKSLQVTDLPRKAEGTWPMLGEVCDQFVFDLVAALFGAEDPETGRRLIREALLLISKKNGKSMIAAGIMMTALIVGWRENAELLILAPTLEVAKNSFTPAMGMVRADPELAVVMKVVEHQREIRNLANGSVLKVVAADSDTVSGNKAWAVLIEELWLFGKKPKSEAMLREATGGQSARPEAFTLAITTHSDEPPAGVFRSKLAYARDVRDGIIDDPSFLPMLYEWPEAMIEAQEYLDPANFHITNPHLGRSVTADWLAAELAKEQSGQGEGLQVFLAKHLNVEIGLRLRRDRWLGADYWEAAAWEPLRRLETLLERSEVAVVGIDGGGLDDLTGVCVLGRDRLTGVWLYWYRAWAHVKVLEVRKDISTELKRFEAEQDLVFWGRREGQVEVAQLLEAGDGATRSIFDEDVIAIVGVCRAVRDAGLMPEEGAIGVDRAAIGAVIDALVEEDFTLTAQEGPDGQVKPGQVEAVSQSAVNMNSAIIAQQRKLEAGGAAHGGTGLMQWCVGNAKAVQRGNSVAIDKQESGKAKIDPLVAGFIATKLMERNPVAAAEVVSPYASRGLITV